MSKLILDIDSLVPYPIELKMRHWRYLRLTHIIIFLKSSWRVVQLIDLYSYAHILRPVARYLSLLPHVLDDLQVLKDVESLLGHSAQC